MFVTKSCPFRHKFVIFQIPLKKTPNKRFSKNRKKNIHHPTNPLHKKKKHISIISRLISYPSYHTPPKSTPSNLQVHVVIRKNPQLQDLPTDQSPRAAVHFHGACEPLGVPDGTASDGWIPVGSHSFQVTDFQGDPKSRGPPRISPYLDVPLEVRINGDRISGLVHLPINGIFLGVKQPTDPNHWS